MSGLLFLCETRGFPFPALPVSVVSLPTVLILCVCVLYFILFRFSGIDLPPSDRKGFRDSVYLLSRATVTVLPRGLLVDEDSGFVCRSSLCPPGPS